MTHAQERRARLLEWMRSRNFRHSTSQLAEFATFDHHGAQLRIYVGNGRYDKCNRDLKALQKDKKVEGYGKPKRWRAY